MFDARSLRWHWRCLALCGPAIAAAELAVGAVAGVSIPGLQDLKVKTATPGGVYAGSEAEDVSPSVGPIAGLSASYWLDSFPYLGVQADALYWYTSASATASPAGVPIRVETDQNWTGLILSVLGRVFLGDIQRPYLYGGLGAGVVYSAVSNSGSNVGPGFSGVLGLAIPITTRLRLKGEVRYLVTGDVDGDRPSPTCRAARAPTRPTPCSGPTSTPSSCQSCSAWSGSSEWPSGTSRSGPARPGRDERGGHGVPALGPPSFRAAPSRVPSAGP